MSDITQWILAISCFVGGAVILLFINHFKKLYKTLDLYQEFLLKMRESLQNGIHELNSSIAMLSVISSSLAKIPKPSQQQEQPKEPKKRGKRTKYILSEEGRRKKAEAMRKLRERRRERVKIPLSIESLRDPT